MQRRVFGLESEYGVTATVDGKPAMSVREAAAQVLRRLPTAHGARNQFLENGGRLYLDTGDHPEYATAEVDNLADLVAADKAGERLLATLGRAAEASLADRGAKASVWLFKNNRDSSGETYGCHENYLVPRDVEIGRIIADLVPFLVTRQIYAGAGWWGPDGFQLSQRAEFMRHAWGSGVTRDRAVISGRDEAHADAAAFRRLHVIVGDSNMSEYATALKVGTTALVLRTVEEGSRPRRDFSLADPAGAGRAVAADLSFRTPLALAGGGHACALDVQWYWLARCARHLASHGASASERTVLGMWRACLEGLEAGSEALGDRLDWVAKRGLIDAYAGRHHLATDAPELAAMELQYHDIRPERGLYYLLERAGRMRRFVTEDAVAEAMSTAPTTTRAHLRGQFCKAVSAYAAPGRAAADWALLRYTSPAGKEHQVALRDPFAAADSRVDALIAKMRAETLRRPAAPVVEPALFGPPGLGVDHVRPFGFAKPPPPHPGDPAIPAR